MVRSNQIGDAPVASNSFHHSDRRKFFQTALAGALGGAAMLARPRESSAKLNPIPPGIKIAVQMPGAPVAELKDEDLQFVQQVGTEYVCIWTDAASATLETAPGASRGAMFVLVRPRGRALTDSTASALEIIRETGVALVPGAAFGRCGEGWLRLSFAGATVPVLEEALSALEAWCER